MANLLQPDTTGKWYNIYAKKWAKIETILEGDDGIKEAGKAYLPQLTGQTAKEYASYKDRGVFFNAFSRTAQGLTGAIVRKDPVIKTDKKVEDLLPRIGANNESIQEANRLIVQSVIQFGYYGVLVGMDAAESVNAKPYFAFYCPSTILNFKTVQEGDELKLVKICLLESKMMDDPTNKYNQIETEQVRDMEIVGGKLIVKIFVKKPGSGKNKDEVWLQEGADIEPKIVGKPLDFIPFVFFGSVTNTPKPDEPPLMDLANLNIKHWQLTVDYYHGLHYCAIPTAWAAGFGEKADLYLGGTKAWVSDNPQANCGYLEFTGAGLGEIANALSKLESQMAILGARLLEEQKKAAEAADTVRMRYSGDTATLSSIVNCVEQGLTKAIDFAGRWLNMVTKTEVSLNREFVSERLSAQDITALLSAWQAGGISIDTFLYQLQTGEILSPDTSIDDEKGRLDAELAKYSPTGMDKFGGNPLEATNNAKKAGTGAGNILPIR